MPKTTLLAAGCWAFGLLAGLFAWLSPDSALFPTPVTALVLVGLALVLLLIGAVWSGRGPKPSVGETVGAIAPLLGAAVALVLAARGWLPHPALPSLFVVLFGIGVLWWSRGRMTAPITWVGDLWTSALMVIALFVVLPALLLGAAGQIIWSVAAPNFDRAAARSKVTDALNSYRPAPRAGISADAAGLAFQAIAATGAERKDSLMMDVPGTQTRPWLPDSNPFNGWNGDSVVRHAVQGLSSAERRWLSQLATHPGLPLLDTVAYAAVMDPWAALKTPLGVNVTPFMFPVPQFGILRAAARVQLYRAALAMADRRPAVADSLARLVIGFGMRMRDDSDLLINALIGSTIAREGGLTLAEIWRATGRTKEGDELVAALTYPDASATSPAPETSPSPRALRARLIARAGDSTAGRAIRFEHLSLLGISSCADLRELLYGPAPAIREAFASAAPLYQRSAKEQEVFARLSTGIFRVESGAEIPAAFRPAAVAFGRRPVAACVQMVGGMGM